MNQRRFPDGFLWGTATSSHQVEGDNHNNDWWEWERGPGRIRDGSRSGAAAEWWRGRAEQDLALAAELGQNAHRLSVEWSRLEPDPGRWSGAAFERYRTLLDAARRRGLQMMVTLSHFTLPRWAARLGGWQSGELAQRFGRFADRCARELGEHVDLWVTLNEPAVLAYTGYAGTRWPPGTGSLRAARRALVTMLGAHAAGYHALHAAGVRAPVGIALNMPTFEAHRRRHRDRAAAAAQDWAFNGVLLRALATGRLHPPLGFGTKVDGLKGAYDFLGINYYGRYRVELDPSALTTLGGRHVQDGNIRTEWTDWGEPAPAGLTSQLQRLARLGAPLYVTENGIYDNDDLRRTKFLYDHLVAVHEALDAGVDVRGYFHWSLIDNFEWAEGWDTHFGLVAMDPATQQRRKRPSADLYARICREGALPERARQPGAEDEPTQWRVP